MRLFLLGIVLIYASVAGAQIDQRIGEWRSHLPQNLGLDVEQTTTHIIYSTPWSLIYIDKEERTPTFVSTIDGLSETGINTITYDPFNEQLIVGYTNSNLDILKDGNIINVPNIAANTSNSGDRTINEVYIQNATTAYIATSFGMVTYNPQQRQFGSTTFSGLPIRRVVASDRYVYAATSEGLYRIDRQADNIADFDEWELLGSAQGLPSFRPIVDLTILSNQVIVALEDGIYRSADEQTWVLTDEREGIEPVYVTSSADRLMVGWTDGGFGGRVSIGSVDGPLVDVDLTCTVIPRGGLIDEQDRVWLADGVEGIKTLANPMSSCELLRFNGPFSHLVSDIVVQDDLVLAANGGVSDNFGFLFSREGMYLRDGTQWNSFNEFRDARLATLEPLSINEVAIHPSKPLLYGGSYWAGLLEYDREEDRYTLFNQTNSTLRGSIGDPARERVTGLVFDAAENLWVTTYNASEPLNLYRPDGSWTGFPVVSPGTLSDVIIDQEGYLWCPVFGISGGVLVYDPGDDPQSRSDDRQKFFTPNNSELPSNQVNTIVVDRDGVIWVGTAEGTVAFDCGRDPFEDGCRGFVPRVEQDGIPALLLADQDIRAIEVDGADNKWFGSRNGIFIQSPDGEDQIAVFTEDNSPLFDNSVTSMAYQETTGIMYIGTNKGILSYRTDTSPGEGRHRESDVYAFPNPVQPDYRGPIAITGLVDNALVKITDVNGRVVIEVRANGGQAIWDGRTLSGEEVSSGVYLVWSAETDTFDNPDAFVTKVMVLR